MNDLITSENYGFATVEKRTSDSSLIQIEQTRAAAEVQASFIIAKQNPRDENSCFQKIMKSCERPFLAEQAMYAYPRGGTVVTGPSIRMAEVLAQCWGNIDFGVREISQSNGVSVAEAYAIDLETNVRQTKIFHVAHERHTKKGKTRLTDPRDIYELVANNGSRRMRACILGIIPGDIIDAAVDKCKQTLTNGKEPIADRIRKMVTALDEQGIKIEHIEKRLGHKLDSIIEQELITLRGIYKSLKDGMAKREDFFDLGNQSSTVESITQLISDKKTSLPTSVFDPNPILSGKEEYNPNKLIATTNEFEKIKNQLLKAKSLDTLNIAADLIRECKEEKEVEELISIYNERKDKLK